MKKKTTDTSAKSLREEKENGNVGKQQLIVLDIIAGSKSGITDRETLQAMRKRCDSDVQTNVVTARRNELWKRGLIERLGKRTCTVTGKTVYAWRVV